MLNIKQRQKQGQYQKIHRFRDNTGAIWRKKLQQWQLPQLHMLTLTRPLAGNSGAKQKEDRSNSANKTRNGKMKWGGVDRGAWGESNSPMGNPIPPSSTHQPTATPPPMPAPGGEGALGGRPLFWGPKCLACPLNQGSRTPTTSAQAYYLTDLRPSSSALFQRVCLAWD